MKKAALALMLAIASIAHAKVPRNTAVILEFKENNVCPATGKKAIKGDAGSYHCPGYVVDHGIPRCAGGPDAAHNLFYQKKDKVNSLKKDKAEIELCRRLKAAGIPFKELDQ